MRHLNRSTGKWRLRHEGIRDPGHFHAPSLRGFEQRAVLVLELRNRAKTFVECNYSSHSMPALLEHSIEYAES
eukprot:CAMPEP_0119301098 /NCGR_PEP_ID=MMETSP1333-20130426/2932_1 /TAXON_ID=418940 /ORGANISM="Scyphosphaera apsteinii, Strain RCC1455" /LENGTH=72 /DNA_ID=CAMNT_0007303077 /DNA_START=69 /DNA_END=287 /DNA_ORIENTATION=+